MRKSEQLARLWMRGTRNPGPGMQSRPEWEHPQDIVKLLRAVPGTFDRVRVSDVAWLHDVVEDGKKDDGSSPTSKDLYEAGIELSVIEDIDTLTHRAGESKPEYLKRVARGSDRAKLVKVADRLCNLREAVSSGAFVPDRLARYIEESKEYVAPLALELIPPTREWMVYELGEAIEKRSPSKWILCCKLRWSNTASTLPGTSFGVSFDGKCGICRKALDDTKLDTIDAVSRSLQAH